MWNEPQILVVSVQQASYEQPDSENYLPRKKECYLKIYIWKIAINLTSPLSRLKNKYELIMQYMVPIKFTVVFLSFIYHAEIPRMWNTAKKLTTSSASTYQSTHNATRPWIRYSANRSSILNCSAYSPPEVSKYFCIFYADNYCPLKSLLSLILYLNN
jgi:hypothetical protein